jgi:hypothetical protein
VVGGIALGHSETVTRAGADRSFEDYAHSMLTFWYRTPSGAIIMTTEGGGYGRYLGCVDVPEDEVRERAQAAEMQRDGAARRRELKAGKLGALRRRRSPSK